MEFLLENYNIIKDYGLWELIILIGFLMLFALLMMYEKPLGKVRDKLKAYPFLNINDSSGTFSILKALLYDMPINKAKERAKKQSKNIKETGKKLNKESKSETDKVEKTRQESDRFLD